MIFLFVLGCLPLAPPASASTLTLEPDRPVSRSGRDDVRQLQTLASGVGQEFSPTPQTSQYLKRIGIKTVRCINVDQPEGTFTAAGEFHITKAEVLDATLKTCRQVGATPHVVIAQRIPPGLAVRAGGGKAGVKESDAYGPTDWKKFRAYTRAIFRRVLVTQGFPQARFEVGNEPDSAGTFVPAPPRPAPGSKAMYAAYLTLYRNVAQAAGDFEAQNPGVRVRLGGPALSLPFTFKYGDFNWATQFLKDTKEQRLRLDFIGVHFYGNLAPLRGESPGNYPSFASMIDTVRASRDRYHPGLPIWLTEWGPSYHTDNSAAAAVNANHVGAAWDADFLNVMLESRVSGALYLVTTDLAVKQGKGLKNVWGWPSLFVNPVAVHGPVPKAPAHLLDMVSRLKGERIEATLDGASSVRCLASADRDGGTVTLLLWNYNYDLPEFGAGKERARTEDVTLRVREAARLFGDGPVKVEQWRVSATESNAHALFLKGKAPDKGAQLKSLPVRSLRPQDDLLETKVTMPPSSVSFVTLSRQ